MSEKMRSRLSRPRPRLIQYPKQCSVRFVHNLVQKRIGRGTDLTIPKHIRDWLDSQGIAYDSGRLRAHIYFLNDDQRALFKLKFQ